MSNDFATKEKTTSNESKLFYTLVKKIGIQPSEVIQLNPLQKTVLIEQYNLEVEKHNKQVKKRNRG